MSRALFSDAITVYHRDGDSFTRQVIEGVQWRQKVERLNDNGKLSLVTVTDVTIPASAGVTVSVGDVMIRGQAPPLIGSYTIADLKKAYSTFCTVRTVTDNTCRPRLKHWKVTAV